MNDTPQEGLTRSHGEHEAADTRAMQEMVLEFHEKFGLTINEKPTLSPADDILRVNLIHEEAMELWAAERFAKAVESATHITGIYEPRNDARVAIADALGDLAYVIYGAGVTYGISIGERSASPIGLNAVMLLWLNGTMALTIDDLEAVSAAIACMNGTVKSLAAVHEIPLEPVFGEIHRSNMSKLWTYAEVYAQAPADMDLTTTQTAILGGRAVKVSDDERGWLVKRADGKVIKSPSYSPANLGPILAKGARE